MQSEEHVRAITACTRGSTVGCHCSCNTRQTTCTAELLVACSDALTVHDDNVDVLNDQDHLSQVTSLHTALDRDTLSARTKAHAEL